MYLFPLGMMAFTVADYIFGPAGTMILNITILTIMAAATAAEVIAISSILVSDFYMVYLRVRLSHIVHLHNVYSNTQEALGREGLLTSG